LADIAYAIAERSFAGPIMSNLTPKDAKLHILLRRLHPTSSRHHLHGRFHENAGHLRDLGPRIGHL
jgi:hypothetical protein